MDRLWTHSQNSLYPVSSARLCAPLRYSFAFAFSLFYISAPLGALHTFIASFTLQDPAVCAGRAGEAGIRPLRRGFRCAVLLRHLNASKVRQPRRTLNLFCPPANSMRSPSAFAAPGGPGRRGFTKPPILVFFREGGGPHAGL